ncbi:MAG: hypothetical protein CM15mP42_10270 [Methanobacteriota archaeon]|nr:MAG: hypothetical protein CM15mP42_10270 [Euryarchaeota archaeon]
MATAGEVAMQYLGGDPTGIDIHTVEITKFTESASEIENMGGSVYPVHF